VDSLAAVYYTFFLSVFQPFPPLVLEDRTGFCPIRSRELFGVVEAKGLLNRSLFLSLCTSRSIPQTFSERLVPAAVAYALFLSTLKSNRPFYPLVFPS